ncbi:hypothetical protein CpipJ_CPIJ005174 [Culex quinquefasciatus]|uniref:Uncharacterized protein n=1 Tax=Culex quinquefasciatus TaxID=7176 RepID=B0WE20_CULQU|nr:hypothetical protein CpipJ_CPIJ005174 [Culex quinquefasciatus]|eukprot:XP_001846954.1 hypothetical protein CpipJ_CPIJ005174 [Culex quinquefasciatus]
MARRRGLEDKSGFNVENWLDESLNEISNNKLSDVIVRVEVERLQNGDQRNDPHRLDGTQHTNCCPLERNLEPAEIIADDDSADLPLKSYSIFPPISDLRTNAEVRSDGDESTKNYHSKPDAAAAAVLSIDLSIPETGSFGKTRSDRSIGRCTLKSRSAIDEGDFCWCHNSGATQMSTDLTAGAIMAEATLKYCSFAKKLDAANHRPSGTNGTQRFSSVLASAASTGRPNERKLDVPNPRPRQGVVLPWGVMLDYDATGGGGGMSR